MSSPHGADDPGLGALTNGALTHDERAALAAWADQDDPPDGFADRVVVSLLAERLGHAGDGEGASAAEAAAVRSRATIGEGRVVRLVGFVTAIAAAAGVMLMVRVLPRASEVERERESARVAEAAPALSPLGQAPAPMGLEGEVVDPVQVLGEDAGRVLAQHCSPCHDSDDPEANPASLQVFDLRDAEWWHAMSEEQLEGVRQRMPQGAEATDDERRRVNAFVDALQGRASCAG